MSISHIFLLYSLLNLGPLLCFLPPIFVLGITMSKHLYVNIYVGFVVVVWLAHLSLFVKRLIIYDCWFFCLSLTSNYDFQLFFIPNPGTMAGIKDIDPTLNNIQLSNLNRKTPNSIDPNIPLDKVGSHSHFADFMLPKHCMVINLHNFTWPNISKLSKNNYFVWTSKFV